MRIDPRKETGIAVFTGIIIMLLVGLLLLSGCTVKKVVTETIVTHDTLTVNHRDTLWQSRTIVHRDTTHIVTERIITIREGGDTLRIETNNNIIRYIERSDSSDRYRHIADSLQAVIDKSKGEKVTKTKVPVLSVIQWAVISILVLGVFIVVLKSKVK